MSRPTRRENPAQPQPDLTGIETGHLGVQGQTGNWIIHHGFQAWSWSVGRQFRMSVGMMCILIVVSLWSTSHGFSSITLSPHHSLESQALSALPRLPGPHSTLPSPLVVSIPCQIAPPQSQNLQSPPGQLILITTRTSTNRSPPSHHPSPIRFPTVFGKKGRMRKLPMLRSQIVRKPQPHSTRTQSGRKNDRFDALVRGMGWSEGLRRERGLAGCLPALFS